MTPPPSLPPLLFLIFSCRFDNRHMELNTKLRDGRSDALAELCQRKLSNYGGGGAPFHWLERDTRSENTKNAKNTNNNNNNSNKKKQNTTTTTTTTTSPIAPISTTTAPTSALQPNPINVPPAEGAAVDPPTPATRELAKIDPKAYFQIAQCHAIDLTDLMNGVNLDVFI